LAEIDKAVSSVGGIVEYEKRTGQPEIIMVKELGKVELRNALESTRDPHGRQVEVVENSAARILAFLDEECDLTRIFRPVTLGTGLPIQCFDVEANKWRNTEALIGAGAFRISGAGTSYVFRASSGQAYSGPHELVKLAAAREAGFNLHSYDASSRAFLSRLGCEPPGLLGRALVACSGELPTIEAGVSSFKNVGPDVAVQILRILYEGEMPK
jgi:hypothetical protein